MSGISPSSDFGSPLYAPVVASAGTTTVVTNPNADLRLKIRVMAANVIASNPVNVKWQTSTGPTDLTGFAYLAQNGGYILPYNPIGWFETLRGDNLLILLSAGVPVGGHITYILA
jgi:hypothetical protein